MKKLISEESLRRQKIAGILTESEYNEALESVSEGISDGGKYNLSDQENMDDFMREITGVINKYVGVQSTDNAAVGNDNRVIIYNMLNSGEFQKIIQQVLPPSTMHKAYNHETSEAEYWTNNPEAMSEFLTSIGITDFKFRSLQ